MNEIIKFIERNLGPKLFGVLSGVGVYLSSNPDIRNLIETLKETEPNLWIGVIIASGSVYLSRLTKKLPNELETIKGDEASNPAIVRERISDEHPLDGVVVGVDKVLRQDKPAVPIGIRQNNPLNIESTPPENDTWQGELPTPNRYAGFKSAHYGLRAAAYLLRLSYFERRGLTTIRGIILRWAPHGDNHPDSVRGYINFVCKELGVGPDEHLIIGGDKAEMSGGDVQLMELIKAMCRFENAQQMPYTNAEIYQAIKAI